MLLKLANVLFTQELKHCASGSRLQWLTGTTLYLGVADTNLWHYIVKEERLAKMKNGGGLGLLALGVTLLFAKMPEEGVSMQGYLAAMSNDVVKGAFYKEMMEKGDLPWFTKDNTKARAL